MDLQIEGCWHVDGRRSPGSEETEKKPSPRAAP